MTDYKSITESPFYEKANKYVEETGNNDCTLEAYIDGATEATKELQEQIDKLTKELDEYKNIDKRLICNHKYFTSDIKNNNLAVICHSVLDCDKCGRWEEE